MTKIDRGLNYALRLLKLEAMGDKIADIDILIAIAEYFSYSQARDRRAHFH
ncbi:MAG: hypothetical protein EBE86_023495 [Hormoscilla sp. GUM202]|nr:hypothetical protein [Hormoscilla sp. GUM202]